MENRPENQRNRKDDRYQPEPRYPDQRQRQPSPAQPYRRERYEPPSDMLDEVLAQIATLERTVAKLAESALGKDEILGLVREAVADFKRQLANYYPADFIDAKLAERAQILQALRSEWDDFRQKMQASHVESQVSVSAFVRAFWSTWQARAVLASVIVLGGIFTGVIIIDIAMALLRK